MRTLDVGFKIKLLRKQQRLTLKELSEKSGLSVSFISDIENNRRNPNLQNLNKLSDSLGVPVTNLLETNQEVKCIEPLPELEILNIYQSLPDDKKVEAKSYLLYLKEKSN